MEDQIIYILRPYEESIKAKVIDVMGGTIFYEEINVKTRTISLFEKGGDRVSGNRTTWTASPLVADLHNDYINNQK